MSLLDSMDTSPLSYQDCAYPTNRSIHNILAICLASKQASCPGKLFRGLFFTFILGLFSFIGVKIIVESGMPFIPYNIYVQLNALVS